MAIVVIQFQFQFLFECPLTLARPWTHIASDGFVNTSLGMADCDSLTDCDKFWTFEKVKDKR